ncbi:MAG TPA: pilus assembly PilX N-terminal domain-containing protein [Candidatus Paceibacterota bacterium]
MVSSILLAVGLAILNISTKEVALSSAARESEVAFYAADAGLECMFRWDLAGKFVIPEPPSIVQPPTAAIFCNDKNENVVLGRTTVGSQTHWTGRLNANFDDTESNPCFKVSIEKHYEGANVKTHIESRGYNTCDTGNLRRLERAIKLDY